MDSKSAAGNGIGLGTVLFLIFLVLKLCGVIDWSWWWVTAPLWCPLAFFGGIILVCALVIGVASIVAGKKS